MPKAPYHPTESVQDILRREKQAHKALPYPENKPRKHKMALHMKGLYAAITALILLPFITVIAFAIWMWSVSCALEDIKHDLAYMDMSITYLSEDAALAKEGYAQHGPLTIADDVELDGRDWANPY